MDKDPSSGKRPRVWIIGWNKEHTAYKCTDAVDVHVPSMFIRQEQSDSKNTDYQTACANGVRYEARKKAVCLFVSGTGLNRDMSQIVQGAKRIRTITFPNTVRRVMDAAFMYRALRAVVLNEGLEALGEYQNDNCARVFSTNHLRRVTLPSTLQVLGGSTFASCENLREVTFAKESRLKAIGKYAFSECVRLKNIVLPEGLEAIGNEAFGRCMLKEITLPKTLKTVEWDAFDSFSISAVYV